MGESPVGRIVAATKRRRDDALAPEIRSSAQKPRRARWLRIVIIAGAVVASAGALAATATTTFLVQITILASCAITSAPNLNFGSQGVLAANVDASTIIAVQCTPTTNYSIGLNIGTGAGATFAARRMTGPASQTVTYSLYQDAGRTTLWGNTPPTDTVAATGNGAAQNYTIYGRVPPQTTPGAGAYSDTITIEVTY